MLGSILRVILLNKTVSKYPEKPCNTEFCCTLNIFVSYLELSITLAENIKIFEKYLIF